MNAQDAILAAVIATLQAAPALAGVLIEEDIQADELPTEVAKALLVSVELSAPELTRLSGAPVDWSTTIRIDCVVRNDSRTPQGRPSWLLYADAFAALMQTPELGGLAMALDCTLARTDRETAATRIGAVNSYWRVRHRTAYTTTTPA